MSEIVVGATRWRDLVDIKASCFACGATAAVQLWCHVPGASSKQVNSRLCVVYFSLFPRLLSAFCAWRHRQMVTSASRAAHEGYVAGPALSFILCSLSFSHTPCSPMTNHQLQNTYNGTGVTALQATLNKHFGYAHAGGMQDTVGGAATGGAATAAGSGSSAAAAPSMPPSVPAYASATPSYA